MRTREEILDSGNTSPPSPPSPPSAPRASLPMAGLDSGVGNSFSSRENTPRDNDEAQNEGGERKDEDKKEESKNDDEEDEDEDEEEGSESGSESGEGEEDTESEGEVVKGKTPFVLLKQLVGIMRLSGGVGKLRKLNVEADEEPKVEADAEKEHSDVEKAKEEEKELAVVGTNGTISHPNIESIENENIEEEKYVDNVNVIR